MLMLFEVTEKQILAIKAVVYGCNTNRRLVGSTFVSGIGSESEQTISFYEAISIADDLLEQPAVDAVPVVRCKECEHYWKNVNTFGYDGVCTTVSDDDFCSYGKRKDGDG